MLDIILNISRHAIIGGALFARKCDRNVLWQEDECSNRLREETLTLITEDSREERRVRSDREREIQGNKVN